MTEIGTRNTNENKVGREIIVLIISHDDVELQRIIHVKSAHNAATALQPTELENIFTSKLPFSLAMYILHWIKIHPFLFSSECFPYFLYN